MYARCKVVVALCCRRKTVLPHRQQCSLVLLTNRTSCIPRQTALPVISDSGIYSMKDVIQVGGKKSYKQRALRGLRYSSVWLRSPFIEQIMDSTVNNVTSTT